MIQKKTVMSATQMSDSEEKERSPPRILEQCGQQENTTASIILSKMSLWYPERKLMLAKKKKSCLYAWKTELEALVI